MKADGVEYEERMALLEEVTLAHARSPTCSRPPSRSSAQSHPWVVRVGAVAQVGRARHVRAGDDLHRVRLRLPAGPLRGPGAALPHRRLPHPAPDRARRPPQRGVRRPLEWLGETVRQTDSSLLDEWEALSDPDANERLEELEGLAAHGGTRPNRPITANERAFRVMVRNAMFRRVELAARDRFGDLAALEAANAALPEPPGSPHGPRRLGRGAGRLLRRARHASAPTPTPGARSCSPSPTPAVPPGRRGARPASTASGWPARPCRIPRATTTG